MLHLDKFNLYVVSEFMKIVIAIILCKAEFLNIAKPYAVSWWYNMKNPAARPQGILT